MTNATQPIKTDLTIILRAGTVEVAESRDPVLWQEVLAAISSPVEATKHLRRRDPEDSGEEESDEQTQRVGTKKSPAAALAKELGVTVEVLEGAISPSTEAPYLHLDEHSWAQWTKVVPQRGPSAVSSTALAATLLALWFKKANLGAPTIDDAQAVLKTIHVTGLNPRRSLKNCRWLQLRGDNQVVPHAARIADAVKVARAFCEGESPDLSE